MIIIHYMNDNHSNQELIYKPRWLASLLREAVKDHPIIVLTGARQVGKSTLLREEDPFSGWRYLNLDDFDILEQARNDPTSLLAGSTHTVIDEVQRVPNLLSAVKIAVDSNPGQVRFVLSGSANLLLMEKVTESLAGRAVHFPLQPMTFGEMEGVPPPAVLKELFQGRFPKPGRTTSPCPPPLSLMWKGFMPSLMNLENAASVNRWWEGYVTTFLERDLRQLSQIEALPDFRRLMTALALRCGQHLNQTELARDLGLSQPTAHRYINLLETTCLVERIPAFAVNRTKRLIKSPKVIWNDPGLASFLGGHHDEQSLGSSRESGGIFESLVHLHLKVLCQLLTPRPSLFHWRTTTGKEVDFVLEWGRKLLAFEVKLTSRPKYADTGTLKLFLEEYPETAAGILVHGGEEIRLMQDRIIALPWHYFTLSPDTTARKFP